MRGSRRPRERTDWLTRLPGLTEGERRQVATLLEDKIRSPKRKGDLATLLAEMDRPAAGG